MVELRIDDYYELLALHKALLEAKFHPDPDNPDVPGSPFVARIAERTLATLIEMERERGGPDKAREWDEWARVEEGGRFWKVSVERAAEYRQWSVWNDEQKRQLATDLLSPFRASEANLENFLREADTSARKPPDELAEIQARCDRASPGPWRPMIEGRHHTSGSSFIMVGPPSSRREDLEMTGATGDDLDFIAHARQDVPRLVEEVRRLRKLLDDM